MDGPLVRPLTHERDWRAVRELLLAPGQPLDGWNWDVRRWDGTRYHLATPRPVSSFAETTALWESPGGELLGAVHDDGDGRAVLELRPGARHLEEPMLRWAATHLRASTGPRAGEVTLQVLERDVVRQDTLAALGGRREQFAGWRRRQLLPVPDSVAIRIPAGYEMRVTNGGPGDCAAMASLLNAAFDRSLHSAQEYATFTRHSPSFDHALNLVAVTGDGAFAAHVGITLEPGTRRAIVEPVCTHPGHRRRGLAETLLLQGLRLAGERGAPEAVVDTGPREAVTDFYVAAGFVEAERRYTWSLGASS